MRRLFALSARKIAVMFGGKPWLLPLVFAALCVCFAAFASAVTAPAGTVVRIAAFDECGNDLSYKLISGLAATEGFELTEYSSRREAEDAVLNADAEALLAISPDYGKAIASGEGRDVVRIFTAPGSVSAELIRETLAGKLIAQSSYVRAREGLSADGISPDELDKYIAEFRSPRLYTVTHAKGGSADSAVFGRGFPGYEGFAALALMLITITLSHMLSIETSRLVSYRMRGLARGLSIDYLSDALSVFALALLFACAAFAFAPNRSLILAAGLVCYCALLTGLCLLLTRIVRGSRTDLASPMIALVTSIFGGCFADPALLSPVLETVSRFTPQGQLIAAVNGAPAFLAVLTAEAALFCAGGYLLRLKER